VGVPVTAHNEATGQDFTVRTDDQGDARIENLPYGDYLISAEEDGFEPVQPPTWEYTVSSPLPHSVGFPEVGSVVRGQAWDDADGDGIRQDGEPHRQVTFVLSGQSDFLGTVSRSLVSGDDGGYRFEDVPSGTYTVQVIDPAGAPVTAYQAGPDYLDCDFAGANPPTTAPFTFYPGFAFAAYNLDAGFLVS
jgi:hypothetical protein